jgi:nicotinamidase-related amidase
MAGTTLCVVDMQKLYSGCYEVLDNVAHEIDLAKRRGDFIVFLEYGVPGTLPELLKRANDKHDKVIVSRKKTVDGSKAFISAVVKHRVLIKRVRVCGVNRSACVLATVNGLVYEIGGEKIEVACGATIDTFGGHKWSESDRNWYGQATLKGAKLLFPKEWNVR